MPLLQEIAGIALIGLSVLTTVSLWRAAQGMGLFGLAIRKALLMTMGTQGSGLLVVAVALVGLRLFLGKAVRGGKWQGIGALTLFLAVLTGLQLNEGVLPIHAWTNGTAGGFVGNALVWTSSSIFGSTGSWIVIIGLCIVATLGITNVSLAGVMQAGWRSFRSLLALERAQAPGKKRPQPAATAPATKPFEPSAELMIQDYAQSTVSSPEPVAEPAAAPMDTPQEQPVAAEKTPEEPLTNWDVEQIELPQPDYQTPPLNLLNRPFRPRNLKQNRDIYDNSQILESTLEHFGIKAKVIQATKGPAVTRYEIQTAPGTKVSRITSLADDIALSLACAEVRIEAPIPGKAAIGIEVPNKSVSLVLLRDVLESQEFQAAQSRLTVALGKDIAGTAIVTDLQDMPHLLIAGATGSGKSVCINTMIASILYKAKPSEVKFLMIDPKVVELSCYNGIPHLLAPVVNQPKRAASALKWATNEMEKRYNLFAKSGVRDITRYNEWAEQQGKDKIPYIVIIIDELADLMMVARADVEDAICRLAQMARAAGMHLVIGTQRPSTDVITGLIKANIPSRLSFAVSSSTDSRVILDMNGAEKLLGKGDMLFCPVGLNKPLRVQGAYVSNREIESVVEFVGNQVEAQYVDALTRMEEAAGPGGSDERDELFTEAARVVVEAGQASVSLLQRRLRVGYTRAARLVDQLEAAGVVGPYEGSKPRQVFKNREVVKSLLETATNKNQTIQD